MGFALSELIQQLNNCGLTLRRTAADQIEVVGDLSRVTDRIRQAIEEHRQTILSCLPTSASAEFVVPAAAPRAAAAAANRIQFQFDAFGSWLGKHAAWADPAYLESIDRRLSESAETQRPHVVAAQIESMRNEIEVINWASGTLTRKIEIEAKQSTRQAPKKG